MNTSISHVDKIIAEYLIAVETGEETNLDTLCDQHPEHADGIRDYFAVRANVLHVIGTDDSAAAIQIEGYEILREIGRGAMGVVFEAIQKNLHRQVAIKVLKEGALGSAATKKRFEDEAKLIAQLDHENVVGVIDYGVVGGQPYMVMPLARGKALNKAIQKGPVSDSVVATLMLQITSAIAAAHDQGIFHRDIKPGNILADADLTSCQISDFGLAAWNEQTRGLTQTGDIIGTPGYIAPEVIRGKSKGDVKSDIYSIGATIYALLTGSQPFRAATPAESILLAMNSDPVSPRTLNPGIPVDIESICLKCMHPTSDRRYASVHDIHVDLQKFIDGKPVVARPVSAWESTSRWAKRNRGLAATLAATAALTFGLIGVVTYSSYTISKTNEDLKESLEKQESLTASANDAIDDFLFELSESNELLKGVPGTQEKRLALLKKSQNHYRRVIETGSAKSKVRLSKALAASAQVNWLIGNSEETKNDLQRAIAIIEETSSHEGANDRLYSAYEFMSKVELANINLAGAQNWIEKLPAIATKDKNPISRSTKLAQSKLQLANLHRLRGDDGRYEQMLRDAKADLAVNMPNDELVQIYLRILVNLGDTLLHKKELEQATPIIAEAIEIVSKEENAPSINMSEQANVFSMQGQLLTAQGKIGEGVELFSQSLQIQRSLANSNPSVIQMQIDLSNVLGRAAGAMRASTQWDLSKKYREEAIAICESLIGKHAFHPEVKTNLTLHLTEMAILCFYKKQPEEARIFIERTIDVRDELLANLPQDKHLLENLAEMIVTITPWRARGKPEEGVKDYQVAIDLFEKLRVINPGNAYYAKRIASTMRNQAIIFYNIGKTEEASKNFTDTLEIYHQLLSQSPSNLDLLFEYATSAQNLAAFHFHEGSKTDAIRVLNELNKDLTARNKDDWAPEMWRAMIEPMLLLTEIECRTDKTSNTARKLVELLDANTTAMASRFPGHVEVTNLAQAREKHKNVPPKDSKIKKESQ